MVNSSYCIEGKRVWVAGHRGLVGSAIVRRLSGEQCIVLTADRARVDLLNPVQVTDWLDHARPHAIILAAAKVGGILANTNFPAEFIYENLTIETNVIHAAHVCGVEKLLFLGSSCIYPKYSSQPIAEAALLTGALEPTNEWYAVAKIAGIKLCQAYRRQYGCDFIVAMPTNLYGPGDNYDLASAHVLAALLRKVFEAKSRCEHAVEIWGTGNPRREFLHVDDCADALVFLLKNYSEEAPINLGYGKDLTIADLARLIKEVVGFDGDLSFDTSKPDGTPRKLLDTSRLTALGWQPKIALREGIAGIINSDSFRSAVMP